MVRIRILPYKPRFDDDFVVAGPPQSYRLEKCCVCAIRKPTVGFLGCGHICLCESCPKNAYAIPCPICPSK